MSNKDLTKKDLQEIKDAPLFDEEMLPEVKKKIDFISKKLDEEVAEYKKRVEENDRKILEMGYGNEYLKFIRLTRLKPI